MEPTDKTKEVKPIVLFVGNILGQGGMATAFLKLAELLERSGFVVRVLMNYKEDIHKTVVPAHYLAGYAWRWMIHFVPLRLALKLFHCLTGWRFYFCFARHVPHDILVVYGALFDAVWVGYSRQPSVGFFHSVTEKWLCRSFVQRLYAKSKLDAMRRHTLLAGVAPRVVASVQETFGFSEEPLLLPNLFSVDEIQRRAEEFTVDISNDAINLVCVSRLVELKAIPRLLHAVRYALDHSGRKIRLRIIGDGDAANKRQCQEIVRELNLADSVKFLGAKDNPYPYIKASNLLVLSSKAEGFGLVLWEALALSVPVLTTDCGGTAYAVNHGVWGKLVENSDEALSQGLLECVNDIHACEPKCGFPAVIESIRKMNTENEKRIVDTFSKLLAISKERK